MSAEARRFADAALLALSDKKLEMVMEGEQKHVMLSYQWDAQTTIQRMNASLLARGYITWFDLTNMKGSVMDAVGVVFAFWAKSHDILSDHTPS